MYTNNKLNFSTLSPVFSCAVGVCFFLVLSAIVPHSALAYPITSLETPCQTAEGIQKPFLTQCTPIGYLNDFSGPVGWEWKSFQTAERSCAADAPDRFLGPVNDLNNPWKTTDVRPPSLTAIDVQCASQSRVCASAYLCVPNRCNDVDKDGAYLCPANQCLNSSLNPTLSKPVYLQRNTCATQDCDDTDPTVFPGSIPKGTDIVSVSAIIDPAYVAQQQTTNKFTPTTSNVFTPLKITITIKPCVYGPPAFPADISVVVPTVSGTEVISLGTFTFTQLTPGSNTYTTGVFVGALFYTQVEKVIASIVSTGLGENPVTFRITPQTIKPSGYKDFSYGMTNCMQTYGSGRHKIVYMRDDTAFYTQEIGWSKLALSGFNSIEPLKKYQTEFSHFVDLKKQGYTFASIRSSTIGKLRKTSSCGFWNSMYFGTYLDPTQPGGNGNGWTPNEPLGLAIIQNGGYDSLTPYTYVHEFGHAFAGLADEYSRRSSAFDLYDVIGAAMPHCSLKPTTDYSATPSQTVPSGLYGSVGFEGCTFSSPFRLTSITSSTTPPISIFRPSRDSIMRSSDVLDSSGRIGNATGYNVQFNVVSCGHLLKHIKHTATAKENFAECAAMPGIIPVGQ